MNAREWAALTGAGGAWRGRAKRLEGAPGGLEALFDDTGRAGLVWRSGGERRRAWLDGGEAAVDAGLRRRAGLASPVKELGELYAAFHALHPVAQTLWGPERLELRLKEPVPWPRFAVCDASKPFAARPAYWARRLGARGVAAFALAGGRMEIFVV